MAYPESDAAGVGYGQEQRPDGPPLPSYGKDEKCDASALLKWIDAGIPYTSEYWLRRQRMLRKADLYAQAKQILVPSFTSDPTQTAHWAVKEFRDDDPDAIPTPVYDEFSSRLKNEAARLGKPEYEPYVRPLGENPDLKARKGAHVAEDALHQALDDMDWPGQWDLGCLHMPLYGGWFIKSFWETSWDKTVRVPVEGCHCCPECGAKMASKSVPSDQGAEMHQANPGALDVDEDDNGNPRFAASRCLKCQDHEGMGMSMGEDGGQSFGPMRMPGPPSLQPFVPVDQELDEQDDFGRDLGRDLPLGEWRVLTLSPYDVFVANLGIGVPAGQIDEWWESHVETVEWVRMRFDNGIKVKPERGMQLLKYHPIAGERGLYYSATTGGLFTHHTRVKEYHRRPWRVPEKDANGNETGKLKMNRGRSIVMASGIVLYDGDMLIDSANHPGKTIERVHLEYVPHEIRSGSRELHGVAFIERVGDVQDNVNETKAQIQDCRQAMGSPHWLATRDMDFGYETGGSAGGVFLYEPNAVNPSLVPKEVGNTLLSSGVYQEIDQDLQFMDRATALNEVERGDIPPGVTAGVTLQQMAEQSGEQRKPAIRRIKEAMQRVFRHGLELMYELVREPRTLWREREAGSWAQASWTGLDIAGQTQVIIDVEPEHDGSLIKEQKLRDFVNLNPGVMENPRIARMLARKFGVPSEMFAEENMQDESAEREFVDFRDTGKDPVVDPDLDDHLAHYQRHGIDWHGEWARDQEEQGKWDKVLPLLWDWEAKLADQPGPPDPATGQPTILPGLDSTMTQMGVPADPQARTAAAWALVIRQAGHAPADPDETAALGRCITFRAHMYAHKKIGESKQASAQAGVPEAAAPQAPATEAGTMPVPGTGQEASNVGPGGPIPESPGLPQLQNTPQQAPPPA
jgi:hypothetical protein